MQNDIKQILETKEYSSHYLNRYIRFISSLVGTNAERSGNEVHHICPKTKYLFPQYSNLSDHPWNSIILTRRQHYIAHWMLWKCYGGTMATAFWRMSKGKIKSSRIYEKLRDEHATNMRRINTGVCRKHTAETRLKMSETKKGKPLSVSHIAALRQHYEINPHHSLGVKYTEERRAKMNWKRGWKHTDESRRLMSIAMTGKSNGPRSEETKKLLSIANSGGNSPLAKSIVCVETGEIFEGLNLASRIIAERLGKKATVVASSISMCANGKHKTAYGYTWKFVEDPNNQKSINRQCNLIQEKIK